MNIGFPTGTFEPGIPNFHPQSGVNLIGFSKVCFYTGAKHPPNFRLLKPMVKVPQGP